MNGLICSSFLTQTCYFLPCGKKKKNGVKTPEPMQGISSHLSPKGPFAQKLRDCFGVCLIGSIPHQ